MVSCSSRRNEEPLPRSCFYGSRSSIPDWGMCGTITKESKSAHQNKSSLWSTAARGLPWWHRAVSAEPLFFHPLITSQTSKLVRARSESCWARAEDDSSIFWGRLAASSTSRTVSSPDELPNNTSLYPFQTVHNPVSLNTVHLSPWYLMLRLKESIWGTFLISRNRSVP